MIAATLLELLLTLAAIVAGWLLILCLCVLFNEKPWRKRIVSDTNCSPEEAAARAWLAVKDDLQLRAKLRGEDCLDLSQGKLMAMDRAIDELRAQPQGEPVAYRWGWVNEVIQAVCEIERDSPADFPEACIVTPDELRNILEAHPDPRVAVLEKVLRLVVLETSEDKNGFMPHEPREALMILRKAARAALGEGS